MVPPQRDDASPPEVGTGLAHALFNNDLAGVLLISTEGRILAANACACHMLHDSETGLRQRRWAEIVDSDTTCAEMGGESAEAARALRLRRLDGTTFPAEVSLLPFVDPDGQQRTAVLLLDVSEQFAAVDSRGGEQTALRDIIAQAPAFMCVLRGPNHVFELANPAFVSLIGHRDVVGKPLRNALPEVESQGFLDLLDQVYGTGETVSLSEVPVLLQREPGTEPEERFISFVYQPLREPDGTVSGVLVQGLDATARRLAEVELRQRVRQAELAAEIGRGLTGPAPLPQQLQRCVEAMVTHLDAAFARIWTFDDTDPELLVLRASAGCYTRLNGTYSRIRVGQFKIGRIAADRQPHLSNAVPDDPEIDNHAWARREGMMAFAGHPLLVGERIIGVVGMFAQQPLNTATLQALGSVADTIALGIDRSQAEAARAALLDREQAAREEAEAAAATLATINRVGQMLSGELDQARLVQAITDAATELTGAAFGAFFYHVVDEGGERYALYTLSGAPREAFEQFPLPGNTPLFEPVFRGESIIRIDDIWGDPRYGQNQPYFGLPPGHLPVVSYLAVPVIARSSEVLGGLFFGHPEPGVFDARAEELAIGLASHAAVAIENALLYEQVQTAEARYRTLFSGVADAILVADASQRFREANAAALQLLGYGREELLKLRVENVMVAGPEWSEMDSTRLRENGDWHGELELRRKDGLLVPVEIWATVVELPIGPVYLSAIRDVTERKRTEEERRAFLDAAAHDLKNPLGVINGQAQLLRRRLLRGAELPKLEAGISAILSAVERTTVIIDELLDVANLRAGQPLELRPAPTDLVALVRTSVDAHRAAAPWPPVRLETEVPELVGNWDPVRLERVMANLLSNATKYSADRGEVTVRVALDEDGSNPQAVLAVEDQGLGIPPDDLAHVFERFRRGGNVSGRIAGRGLGLAGARQIVEQHGGTIDVRSTEGVGSCFTLRLPVAL